MDTNNSGPKNQETKTDLKGNKPMVPVTPDTAPQVPEDGVKTQSEARPTKRNNIFKNKYVLLIIGLVVAALLIGLALVLLSSNDSGKNSNSESNGQNSQDIKGNTTHQSLISQIDGYVSSTYSDLQPYDGHKDYKVVPVYSDTLGHYIYLINGDVVGSEYLVENGAVKDIASGQQAAEYAEQILLDNGLTINTSVDEFATSVAMQSSGELYTVWYDRADTACLINMGNHLSIVCATKDNIGNREQFLKPFFEAFEAEFGQIDEGATMSVNPSEIETVTPYERVCGGSVNVIFSAGGGLACFYREIGGEWKYSHGGQAAPSCSEFDNEAQQAAFYDEGCAGPGGDTYTVEEYYQNGTAAQNDVERKNAVGRLLALLETYSANNNGVFPIDADAINNDVIGLYILETDFTDPETGNFYSILDGTYGTTEPPQLGEMFYVTKAVCSDAGVIFASGESDRAVAIAVHQSTDGYYCMDNL